MCALYCYEFRYDDALPNGLISIDIIKKRIGQTYELDLSYIIELL